MKPFESWYLSYQLKRSDKWSTKIGLRGEYTPSKTNLIAEKEYFNLFPIFYITEDHSFKVNFGRRIQRPIFWDLNPNKWYNNPISYTEARNDRLLMKKKQIEVEENRKLSKKLRTICSEIFCLSNSSMLQKSYLQF
ncbi:outer membrane beta-barrel protein [Empedobacter brevis]